MPPESRLHSAQRLGCALAVLLLLASAGLSGEARAQGATTAPASTTTAQPAAAPLETLQTLRAPLTPRSLAQALTVRNLELAYGRDSVAIGASLAAA